LARIGDAQGMTPELEAIADAFDANLVEGIAAVLDRFKDKISFLAKCAVAFVEDHADASSPSRAG
jgi:hypothetical protein